MARRSGFAKKIDNVHWTYGSFASLAFSAGTIASTVYGAQHLPETLLRIRGEVMGYVDGTSVPGGLTAVGMGLIQVPEGTGATVLWSPITDGDAPWIWVSYAMLGYEEGVTDVIANQTAMGFRREIDNKAMRKQRNTEIQWVCENATVASALSVNISGQVRMLHGT